MTPGDNALPERAGDPSGRGPNSDPRFVSYYAHASGSEATQDRFASVQAKVLRLVASDGPWPRKLVVADIGCGVGAQSQLWARGGHEVHGVDVSAPLIELARTRASEAGLSIQFKVGTATDLPLGDESVDVCLLPQLLEHVEDWRKCLEETVRVLRPNGVLYLSTTNALCPIQEEFNLPLYSWYPPPLKRYFERLAVTSRPDLVQYATYPALHWFTVGELKRFLSQRGMRCFDRFDLFDATAGARWKRWAVRGIRCVPLARSVAQVAFASSIVLAVKRDVAGAAPGSNPPGSQA
jgi:2-polyprenyl-6-hydroxyphenyl methylase/3-demethylubiquinone-9 3-methyltransferase